MLGPFRQAALVLRWFRERGCVHCLARDTGVSQATGYRYLHEGIDVLAEKAPDLHEVLARCRRAGMTHVILDGTLIESDRLAGVRDNGNDLWFSQKHKAFGGNIQFLSAPDGTPLWVSDVEPGPTPDVTAARLHALPALYKAAAEGLPTLADKGCIGAGIGIRIPRCPRPRRNLEMITVEKTSLGVRIPGVLRRLPKWSTSVAPSRAQSHKLSLAHYFKALRGAGIIRQRQCGLERRSHVRVDDLDARFPGLLALVADWTPKP